MLVDVCELLWEGGFCVPGIVVVDDGGVDVVGGLDTVTVVELVSIRVCPWMLL